MAPGILWVFSRIENKDKLTADKFCDWYENTHIQEVLVLPGFTSALRYSAITPTPKGLPYGDEAPWLTTYTMPDVSYRLTQAFKDVAGGIPPSDDLIEAIYNHTRYDTRFYEERGVFPASCPGSAAASTSSNQKFCVAATFPAPKAADADFPAHFRTAILPQLQNTKGFVRATVYEIADALVLDRWKWAPGQDVPGWLVMAEFEGAEGLGGTGLKGGVEVGGYAVERVYGEEEWGSVGV